MTDDLVKRMRNRKEPNREYDFHGDEIIGDEPDEECQEAADRIETLESVMRDDAGWLAAYHKWCEMNGCAPSSSDLIAAREALEGQK